MALRARRCPCAPRAPTRFAVATRHLGSRSALDLAAVSSLSTAAFHSVPGLKPGVAAGVLCMATVAKDSPSAAGEGHEVLVRYRGTLPDGSVFDSNTDGAPLEVTLGTGEVVPGFEQALYGMRVGERKSVTLAPEKAYGLRKDQLVINIPADRVPLGLAVGQRVALGGARGQQLPARVTEIRADGSAVLDANPELAGKTLTFDIELLGFKQPPQRGLEMIGWGGKRLQVAGAMAEDAVSRVLRERPRPSAWPYQASDFKRQDESNDTRFYDEPRFVTHIDDSAISAIRDFYACQFAAAPQGDFSVLDICSSWVSHYPEDLRANRVAVTGMVEAELAANKQATERVVKDLNVDPILPYGDNEFDFVTNVVSVDYLIRPQEVFRDLHRILKPGGVAIMSFSNRCFPHKAIATWLRDMSDGPGHCEIVGNYFHFSPEGGWRDVCAADISPNPGRTDPVWVVTAVRA